VVPNRNGRSIIGKEAQLLAFLLLFKYLMKITFHTSTKDRNSNQLTGHVLSTLEAGHSTNNAFNKYVSNE
jgi:hypothetical protein